MKKSSTIFAALLMFVATFATNASAQHGRDRNDQRFNSSYRMMLTSRTGDVTYGNWSLLRDFGRTAIYYGAWGSNRCNNISLQSSGFGGYQLHIDGCNNNAACSAQLYETRNGLTGTLYCATGNVWGLTLY